VTRDRNSVYDPASFAGLNVSKFCFRKQVTP
jgi:hypothetical protein